MIWVAARGSVGDTIAPSVNAAAQGRPASSCATTATATAVAADEADGHEPDDARVAAHVPQRGEERADVEQRRQEDDEHDVRVQGDLGRAGDQAQPEARRGP